MKLTVEGDLDEAGELMRSVLRPTGELASEYPLVFNERGSGQLLSLREGGRIVSTCAVIERKLIHPGGETKVGFIGSVVTHPEARGQGYATKLLEYTEDKLRDAGCEHALLWADDPVFYGRRGYALEGHEVDFLVDKGTGAFPVGELNVRPFALGESEAVHSLYIKHEARVARTSAETAMLLECPRMTVLVAERDDEVVSYLCFGRGADLEGVAHEWGGESEGVMACLAKLVADHEAVFVMTPGDPGVLGDRLDAIGAMRAYGRLGMSKPLQGRRELPEGAFIWGLDSI
jgi:GNAT superfamily N-acetyltransferase